MDESQKRPVNSQMAVELQVCKNDLQNTRLMATESGRLAETTAATLANLATLRARGVSVIGPESGAQAFVREHGAEYHYFRKQHQGQPLYVVTYGSFATRDAAQVALRSLPAKVQAGKPWQLNLAGIQQEIAQAS